MGKQAESDQVTKGIVCILASTAVMALGDAIIKLTSSELSLWQIFLIRSTFAVVLLLLVARLFAVSLQVQNTYWAVVRSALLVFTWLLYYAALPFLSLAVAAVAVYTNPIITALLAALLLREKIVKQQWLGVMLGFAGVTIILQPGSETFSWAICLPLLGAALYSLAMILTRTHCVNDDALALALGLHLGFILAGGIAIVILWLVNLTPDIQMIYPFVLTLWPAIAFSDWGLLLFLSILAAAFSVGVARAYQLAPPHIIGVFDNGYIVSAVIWGFVFFAEKPQISTLIGSVLVICAGILVNRGTAK